MRIIQVILLSVMLLMACQTTAPVTEDVGRVKPDPKPKNIILMVGDGMGLGQITAGMYSNSNQTNFARFKAIGLHRSHASNALITDSAAGATAFSTGVKTFNGAIGVGPDSAAIKTILETAQDKGKSVGLIANCSVTHATPASFAAHNSYRKNYEAIAADMAAADVDFLLGGGKKYFANREEDDRNLIEEMKNAGYQVEDFIHTEIHDVAVNADKFAYFTANGEPLPANQGRDYLSHSVQLGLNHLSQNENGFFLVVEGSQIDWGGHANDINYVISEWKEFDRVLGQIMDWVEADGETLLVVTADHETGGLAIQKESKMDSVVAAFTTDYHTGVMIPVFAKGPGETSFQGIYDNNMIYHKMMDAFGWKTERNAQSK